MSEDAYSRAVEGELEHINPYYTIAINFHDDVNLKKKFKKQGRLFPEDIKHVDIKIDHWHDPKKHTIYVIDRANLTFKDVMEMMQADIDAKSGYYFRIQLTQRELEHR